ncbi:hypothetical protein AB0G02_05975 [Actinosynnema sp. NPDC023658]|uniref:hypothetical protein n=1 Tax=Actinosynnema sp. NPDC023658 TaxID=3155465 RepID=UPI0033F093B0
MNLRKTITGAAVTLGGAAVMLGLGGTAQAVDAGAHTRPDAEGELGKVANIGDLVRVDTSDPAGPVVTAPVVLTGRNTGTPLDLELRFDGRYLRD